MLKLLSLPYSLEQKTSHVQNLFDLCNNFNRIAVGGHDREGWLAPFWTQSDTIQSSRCFCNVYVLAKCKELVNEKSKKCRVIDVTQDILMDFIECNINVLLPIFTKFSVLALIYRYLWRGWSRCILCQKIKNRWKIWSY